MRAYFTEKMFKISESRPLEYGDFSEEVDEHKIKRVNHMMRKIHKFMTEWQIVLHFLMMTQE